MSQMRRALCALPLYALTVLRLGNHLCFTIATETVRQRNKSCGQIPQTVYFPEIRFRPITYVKYEN
jgi:hypothetical protein